MPLGFVILNYNSQEFTNALCRQLLGVSSPHILVIVVDNDSPGGFQAASDIENDSRFLLCKSRINGGYGRGNNLGIDLLLSKGVDQIVLLNPDVRIDSPVEFIQCANENFECYEFVVMGCDVDGVSPYYSQLGLFSLLFPFGYRFFERFGKRQRNLQNSFGLVQVGRVHGCGLLLRGKRFRELGLFDEEIFLYCEEYVISLVLNRLGCDLYIDPSLRIRHLGTGSMGSVRYFHFKYLSRSFSYVFSRYFGFGLTLSYLLGFSSGLQGWLLMYVSGLVKRSK